MTDLFRKEVLEAQRVRWTGTIILTRPFGSVFLTLCALGMGLVLVAFGIWGEYTKRSTVKGQLVPQSGLVQAYTTGNGVVIEKYIYEGKEVKTGDILYKISTAQYNNDGNVQEAIAKELKFKTQMMEHEINRTKNAHKQEIRAILNTIDRLNQDKNKVYHQIGLQQNQVNIAHNNLERYQIAKQSEAVSAEAVSIKEMEWATQVESLNNLEREIKSLDKQIQEQKITLERIKQEHEITLAQFHRNLSDNNQAHIQNNSNQTIVIRSSINGVISADNAQMGQFVDTSQALATILPKDDELVAQLYIPSRAIGFVKSGDIVLLRYQAFPYQKFGHAKAEIVSVAKTALAGQSLPTIGTVSLTEQANNEPLYIVRAKLERQQVKAYGQDISLQAGMVLEGDVLHETRKLYEWILEPLYSITGKI